MQPTDDNNGYYRKIPENIPEDWLETQVSLYDLLYFYFAELREALKKELNQ
jgi:hypothetical protein